MEAAHIGGAAELDAEPRADFEPGDEGVQYIAVASANMLAYCQRRRPGRIAQMGDRPDMGVVIVEAMAVRGVDQGGDGRCAASAKQDLRAAR